MHIVSLKEKMLGSISGKIGVYNRVHKSQTIKQKLLYYVRVQKYKYRSPVYLPANKAWSSLKLTWNFWTLICLVRRAPEGGLQITGICSQSAC